LNVLSWTLIQRISYAKTKSYATLRREDPNFIPPTSAHAKNLNEFNSKFANGVSITEKRPRDGDAIAERESKRGKPDQNNDDEDEDDDDEMEIEEDEDVPLTSNVESTSTSCSSTYNNIQTCLKSELY
jgi:hypothetical protein